VKSTQCFGHPVSQPFAQKQRFVQKKVDEVALALSKEKVIAKAGCAASGSKPRVSSKDVSFAYRKLIMQSLAVSVESYS
jgi:Leu/Phe-tRNA-protein transferase